MIEGAQKELSKYFRILCSEMTETPDMDLFLDEDFQKQIIKKIKSILAKVDEENRSSLFDFKINLDDKQALSVREILEKYHFNVVIEVFRLHEVSLDKEASDDEEEYDEQAIIQALQEVAKEKCAKKPKGEF